MSEGWCGSGDLNPDGIATASPSSWCVCQFRHFRVAVRVRRDGPVRLTAFALATAVKKPDTTFHYFAGAGAGAAGAGVLGAGVVGAGVAGAEFAGAGAGAAGLVVAGAGAGVPLTTDRVPPRWPSTDNVSANSMNNTAAIDVALVSSVAP